MTSIAAGRRAHSDWLVPAGLILLAFVPVVAGAARVTELSVGGPITADNARFFASPIPIVVHIVSVTLFALLGALQFAPRLRGRAWHRRSGRVVVPSGIAAALSGVWISVFSGRADTDGDLLAVIRVLVGVTMVVFFVQGFRAGRRRDFAAHRRRMIRGYAIGMGAGTQLFTQAPWVLFVGDLTVASKTVLMVLGWLINIAVAELVIRRGRPGTRRSPSPPAAPGPRDPASRHHR